MATDHRLPSGLHIRVRDPRPDGAERLAQAIRDLSPRSRQLRFLSSRADYSLEELAPFLQPNDENIITQVVAELDENGEEGEAIAIGHVVRDTNQVGVGDIALVVCDLRQGKGVGSTLVRKLAELSLTAGIVRWEGITSSENQTALALLKKVGDLTSLMCTEGIYEFVVDLHRV